VAGWRPSAPCSTRATRADPSRANLSLAKLRPKLSADDLGVAFQLKLLGQCQVAQQHYAEAEQSLRESLTVIVKQAPKSILRYQTESLLGTALVGQRRYGSAEPLLLASIGFFQARAANLTPEQRSSLYATMQRLIELYDALGRLDDAARWRQELAALRKSGQQVP
jgi:hypothetical protein